jgi:hypothetical protein
MADFSRQKLNIVSDLKNATTALTAFSAIDTALAATSRTGYKALTRIKEA